MINRRALLTTAALGAAGIALGACSADQLAQAEAQWATIVGEIQSAVAKAATYIPTVESIAATAASLFGPQYTALVQIGSAAFNQIVATLTNVVTALTPPAMASVRRRLVTSSRALPVVVGTTSTGVQVAGYQL